MSLESLNRLVHPGPIFFFACMTCVSLCGLHCVLMWWPFTDSWLGFFHTVAFAAWNGLILYNFLSAILDGPGHVPRNWMPDNPEDVEFLQYCKICKAFKAPRAHHCTRCKKCILKMDHHCPWINNCVGHNNHANFIYFLAFTILACIHACVILGCSIYRGVYRVYHLYNRVGPYVHLSVNGFLICIFSMGLAIGAIIGLSALLFIQIRLIIKNQTGIESYIVSKANRPRPENDVFIYPYDFGKKENLRQLFCREYADNENDGIDWHVIEGCNKYALTIEQRAQKEEKKRSVREYFIVKKYIGSLFPVTMGIRVACSTPCCTEEPRIQVSVGDKVTVSRWKTHWLYGEVRRPRAENEGDEDHEMRRRGWFPRICAAENVNGRESLNEPEIEPETQREPETQTERLKSD